MYLGGAMRKIPTLSGFLRVCATALTFIISPCPNTAVAELPQKEICGGIAGIACSQGYQCEYPEANDPDAQGVCKKINAPPPSQPTNVLQPMPPPDPAGYPLGTPSQDIPIVQTGSERYTVEEGFDRPGADYENFEQTSAFQSPDLCRDACYSQPQCRSFTYVKPGIQGPQARCWLKNAVPPPVENLCCISGVKGARPPQPAHKTIQLVWYGWDTDKVGRQTTDGQPDGSPDQHMRLSVTLTSPQEVIAIAVYSADDQGIAKDRPGWSSKDPESSILAVETAGHRLNPSHTPSLGRFSGIVVFDLFAADYGQWEKGSVVLVEIELTNGQKRGHWFRLEPPEGRLIGKWHILCDNPSPQAFEPRTLSGRFYMDVQTNGRITGRFANMALTGSVNQSGAASGTAESGEAAITWNGTIPQPVRNRLLKGKGNFKFQRGNQACFSDGHWWSD